MSQRYKLKINMSSSLSVACNIISKTLRPVLLDLFVNTGLYGWWGI